MKIHTRAINGKWLYGVLRPNEDWYNRADKAFWDEEAFKLRDGLRQLHAAKTNSKWKVQVKGKRCSDSWEISVVREDNELGQESWGWFNESKLLVSHNGGPCHWPISGFVWDEQIRIASELCDRMNRSS